MIVQGTSVDLSPETVEEVRGLLSRELGFAGVQEHDIAVHPGEDHDGEPAIMIQVRCRPSSESFDARMAARAVFKLNSVLRQRGEQRFAYIKYDDDVSA